MRRARVSRRSPSLAHPTPTRGAVEPVGLAPGRPAHPSPRPWARGSKHLGDVYSVSGGQTRRKIDRRVHCGTLDPADLLDRTPHRLSGFLLRPSTALPRTARVQREPPPCQDLRWMSHPARMVVGGTTLKKNMRRVIIAGILMREG